MYYSVAGPDVLESFDPDYLDPDYLDYFEPDYLDPDYLDSFDLDPDLSFD